MKKLSLLFLAIAGLAVSGNAAVVLSDNFSYADGILTDVSGGVWSAHSGAGSNPIMVTNSQIAVRGGSGSWEDVNAALAGAPYLETDPTAVLYSSYTLIISNAAGLPPASGTYVSHFRGTNSGAATDFGARVFLSTSNIILSTATSPGTYRISIANGTSGSSFDTGQAQVDQDLATGTVYTVVTRFVPSTGIATLWVNPTAETSPSVTATDAGTVTRPNPFNVFTYAFRQGAGLTSYVDSLKVGTSFNDVIGANTAPLISSIPPQSVGANTTVGPLDFTVSDAESPASSLTVTASSSDTVLVPNANLTLGGSGTNRTITITPAAGQEGTVTITVTVSDGQSTSFTTFQVKFGFPTISTIADQAVQVNKTSSPIAFTIGDAETPGSLTVSATSSNPALVPDSNLVLGGSGLNRTLTITPSTDQAGLASITVSVTDGVNTTSTSFNLTVYPALGLLLGDTFTYPDGPIGTSSGSFWTAHSGTSNDTFIVNNQLILSQTNVDDVRAFFTNSVSAPTTSGIILYSKFTVNFSVLPRFNGGYFAHFKDATTGYRARVFSRTNGAAAGKFRLGIANGGTTPTVYPVDLSLDTTYVVITRYDVGTTKSTLWVNPLNEQSPSVTATDITSATEIWNYAFRQDGTSGGIGKLAVDDLLIGTSFSDVFTAPPAPTPEPITVQTVGGNIQLNWTQPTFSLEAADTVNGTYTRVSGASSPYTVPKEGNSKFYRLAYP